MSTRLNSSHAEIYTLSLHDALPICRIAQIVVRVLEVRMIEHVEGLSAEGEGEPFNHPTFRSDEHTSELQSRRDLHSFPTRRSSDLSNRPDSCPGSGSSDD